MVNKVVWKDILNQDRAAGIIIEDGKILLIHRFRGGKEYWVIPGGSVEEGETIKQALGRELSEELAIQVLASKPLFKIRNFGRFEYYFLITKYEGSPKMGGPELEWANKDNQYILEKKDLAKLSKINLLPGKIVAKLQGLIRDNQWASEVS